MKLAESRFSTRFSGRSRRRKTCSEIEMASLEDFEKEVLEDSDGLDLDPDLKDDISEAEDDDAELVEEDTVSPEAIIDAVKKTLKNLNQDPNAGAYPITRIRIPLPSIDEEVPEVDFSLLGDPRFQEHTGLPVKHHGGDKVFEVDYHAYLRTEEDMGPSLASSSSQPQALSSASAGGPALRGLQLDRMEQAALTGEYSNGSGYDSEDSFIDNSEAVTTIKEPQKTRLGRFFVYDPDQANPDDFLDDDDQEEEDGFVADQPIPRSRKLPAKPVAGLTPAQMDTIPAAVVLKIRGISGAWPELQRQHGDKISPSLSRMLAELSALVMQEYGTKQVPSLVVQLLRNGLPFHPKTLKRHMRTPLPGPPSAHPRKYTNPPSSSSASS